MTRRFAIMSLVAGLAATGMVLARRAPSSGSHADHVVLIENMKFSPALLRVRVGEKVVFRNRDYLPHTATAMEGTRFDSGALQAGQEWVFVPGAAGTLRYSCTFHPMMEGRLVVEEP